MAGQAGAGKSTLGAAVARAMCAPLLDQDAMTNPLLDRLQPWPFTEHWLHESYQPAVREGRYAALRSVAHDVVATAGTVVLVAPFTAELRGGREWDELVAALAPAEVTVLFVDGDPDLLAQRRRSRGADRDLHRTPAAAAPPAVPFVRVDAELDTDRQLDRVLPLLAERTPLDDASPLFSGPFDAVLFDLDGTLVDSTASVARSWRRWAREYGVAADAAANHGRPALDLVREWVPDRSEEALARITDLEVSDAPGLTPVLGAGELYAAVPPERRAIVTSGSPPIALARLRAAGLEPAAVLVTSQDIEHGKPSPEPYLRAAERLGVHPSRCLAVEDAPAGIASARAAGCGVLAVTGTVPADELNEAQLVVDGLDRVTVAVAPDGLSLRVQEAEGSHPA